MSHQGKLIQETYFFVFFFTRLATPTKMKQFDRIENGDHLNLCEFCKSHKCIYDAIVSCDVEYIAWNKALFGATTIDVTHSSIYLPRNECDASR